MAVSLLLASDEDDSPLLLLLFEFSLLLFTLMLMRDICDDFVLLRGLLPLLLELLELLFVSESMNVGSVGCGGFEWECAWLDALF